MPDAPIKNPAHDSSVSIMWQEHDSHEPSWHLCAQQTPIMGPSRGNHVPIMCQLCLSHPWQWQSRPAYLFSYCNHTAEWVPTAAPADATNTATNWWLLHSRADKCQAQKVL